jgi:hypothetical protein
MLALGLFLARSLLGTPLPDAVAGWVEGDAWVPALAAEACGKLFREDPRQKRSVPEINHFYIRTMTYRRDRLKALLSDLFLPNPVELAEAPPCLLTYPACILFRPMRLLGKTFKILLRRFLRGDGSLVD